MSRTLQLGFVPLLDAAPLIAAKTLGMFAAEGLDVDLVREASWATIRDKVATGVLDGAHMLLPMAVASTLGLDAHAAPLAAPLVLNRGGAAVTLSSRIAQGDDPVEDLRRVVEMRREQGASPLTFAVVFPNGIHAFLLRRWLTEAGIDPAKDVVVTVAPPPRMAELLAMGVIDGFASGEPWSVAAVSAGTGRAVVRAEDVWPHAPDKVLAVREHLVRDEVDLVLKLIRVLHAAAGLCEGNRKALAEILAAPEHVGLPPALIMQGLQRVRFSGAGVNAPSEADVGWLVEQMSRQEGPDAATLRTAARQTLRPELFAAALRASPY